MSRMGGVESGFSLACFNNSSNFFSSTLPCDFSASNCLRKTSSRRPASPFSLATAAAKSSMAGGFSGTACAITARVSGSIFRTVLQQGHSTSNRPCSIVPMVALKLHFPTHGGAGAFAWQGEPARPCIDTSVDAARRSACATGKYKPSESNCEDLERLRGFDRGDWLEGSKRGINRFSLGLLLVCHAGYGAIVSPNCNPII